MLNTNQPNTSNRIPNAVLGIIFLVAAEVMFFAGLISAYIVNRAGLPWPPIDQPRLPVEITAFNTVILLASAMFLWYAGKVFKNNITYPQTASRWVFFAIISGLFFLCIQGNEWIKLIGYGLTTSSGLYGAFFYTIIGLHGAHILAGIILLISLYGKIKKSKSHTNTMNIFSAFSLFWYFVVGIWPLLYVLVYLI